MADRDARADQPDLLCPRRRAHAPGSLRLIFPFDPKVTSTTVLPAEWLDDGTFRLPAVLNAPDWGPMLLAETKGRPVTGRLEGSRSGKIVDLLLEFPAISTAEPVALSLAPLLLPPPPGLSGDSLPFWLAARRGWLNALQPCARWGEQDKPFSAPPGILGNNVISDPASISIWFYADQAFFMPEIAPGVSVMPLVRRTIDYWLDKRMRRDAAGRLTGEITGYWDYGDFLDAEASPLIAAWDYVESTGDLDWLRRRIELLELVANFLARRDVDGDGFVEATQPGTPNALQQPNRSDAWWDALNCGHKDGYTNALIYRAWRSLADLELKIGRSERASVYTRLADRLKAVYVEDAFQSRDRLARLVEGPRRRPPRLRLADARTGWPSSTAWSSRTSPARSSSTSGRRWPGWASSGSTSASRPCSSRSRAPITSSRTRSASPSARTARTPSAIT